MKAIAIIRDEHRAITAVLEGLRQLLSEIAAGRMVVDHGLLGALFHYIEQFPERLHHPKEDDYLFARLRLRRPDVVPLLDGLQREHAVGHERLADLKAAWERFRAEPAALPAFVEAVERYSHFHWLHMRKEEEDVLPLAAEALADEDWAAIDAAFASNNDPVVGAPASKAFRELFRHLVAVMPAPYGVGPAPGTPPRR
jgi:hemerythrin-like domain-containing protein